MKTPDNYDQFLAKEAREDAWLRSRPICSHCRKPIQDERLWVIEGETYHPDCAEDEFCMYTEDYIE